MHVQDIMTREVVSVGPKDSVQDVAKKLVKYDIKGLPVVDKAGKVLGMITECDLLLQNAKFHIPTFIQLLGGYIEIGSRERDKEMKKMVGVNAEDVMSSPAVVVEQDTSVEDVATLMWDKKVNPVPVMQGGKMVGIVSRADIVRLIAESIE
jgi:CBS domain-containing protein